MFVPPFAIGRMPVTPVVSGKPTALVSVPDDGVPSAPPEVSSVEAAGIVVPLTLVTPGSAATKPGLAVVPFEARASPAVALGTMPVIAEAPENAATSYCAVVPDVETVPVVKHPVALPLLRTPAAACPVAQIVGVPASDVAVAAFPVVLEVIEAGRSAAVIARRPRAPAAPLGVARNSLAGSPLAKLSAKVPAPVIGEPDTENTEGAVSATLVTVPVPAGVWQLPSPRRYVEELHVPDQSAITFAAVAGVIALVPLAATSPVSVPATPVPP